MVASSEMLFALYVFFFPILPSKNKGGFPDLRVSTLQLSFVCVYACRLWWIRPLRSRYWHTHGRALRHLYRHHAHLRARARARGAFTHLPMVHQHLATRRALHARPQRARLLLRLTPPHERLPRRVLHDLGPREPKLAVVRGDYQRCGADGGCAGCGERVEPDGDCAVRGGCAGGGHGVVCGVEE